MITKKPLALGLGLALAWLGAAAAGAFTVPELQRLLQSSPKPEVKFQELRESPWLPAPVTSRGTMRSSSQGLEKRVDSPRHEVWRLLPDRIEWTGPGADGAKQILFRQVPAVGALADVVRQAVAGDLVDLQRGFRIELTGDERIWTAQLRPRNSDLAKVLDHVELQGTLGQLQVLIIVERSGERTTTRFIR